MKKCFSLILAIVMLVVAFPMNAFATTDMGVQGDANGDGNVTAIDIHITLLVAAGLKTVSKEQEKLIDMNSDGKITSFDARNVLKKATSKDEGGTDETNENQYVEILRLFGYEYDAEQNIYYSRLNAWQRNFGFADIYDNAAAYTAMLYMTLKIDFEYEDLLWRLQWWKGQYGILEGAELGVYTKEPGCISPFYKCAEDEHLLEMYFEYYQTAVDYNKGEPLFTRYEQEHWWLTGFKFGVCDPRKNVVKAVIIAYDEDMADGIENGLKNVTDNEGNWNGFVKYDGENTEGSNFYIREKMPDGRFKFSVLWKDAGYLNYGEIENPECPCKTV